MGSRLRVKAASTMTKDADGRIDSELIFLRLALVSTGKMKNSQSDSHSRLARPSPQ